MISGIPWPQVKDLLNIEDSHTKLIDYPLALHRFRVVIRDEIRGETAIQDCRKSIAQQTTLFPKKTVDGGGNVMRHTNWMESILARLFESLLLENIPWPELVKKFSGDDAPKSAGAVLNSEVDVAVLQKVLQSITAKGNAATNKQNILVTKEQAASLIRTLTGYGGSRVPQSFSSSRRFTFCSC